jgi:hypothetical protein
MFNIVLAVLQEIVHINKKSYQGNKIKYSEKHECPIKES